MVRSLFGAVVLMYKLHRGKWKVINALFVALSHTSQVLLNPRQCIYDSLNDQSRWSRSPILRFV